MTVRITRNNIATEAQLREEIVKTSKANPTKIVVASSGFGTVKIFIHDRQPTTDCPASVETFTEDGGFWKNGQLIQPTKTWLAKHNFCPISR